MDQCPVCLTDKLDPQRDGHTIYDCALQAADRYKDRARQLEIMLTRLLNKVNLVTARFRHHGLSALTDGHMNELVDRQIFIEKDIERLNKPKG